MFHDGPRNNTNEEFDMFVATHMCLFDPIIFHKTSLNVGFMTMDYHFFCTPSHIYFFLRKYNIAQLLKLNVIVLWMFLKNIQTTWDGCLIQHMIYCRKK